MKFPFPPPPLLSLSLFQRSKSDWMHHANVRRPHHENLACLILSPSWSQFYSKNDVQPKKHPRLAGHHHHPLFSFFL